MIIELMSTTLERPSTTEPSLKVRRQKFGLTKMARLLIEHLQLYVKVTLK